MAYLTVRLSAGSYNPTTNSTRVSASVSITWDTAQSYDQTNGTGTLTIGDYSTTFSTNFNASRKQSGTESLGSGSTTIYHNSNGDPVQVVASASGGGRSASDIITLSGGTPSGGGNTGGDTGDDNTGGGNTGGGGNTDSGNTGGGGPSNLERYNLTITASPHVSVYAYQYSPDAPNWPQSVDRGILDTWTLKITYYVEDGYELSEHTINGVEFESGIMFKITSDVHVVVTEKSTGDSGDQGGDDSGDSGDSGNEKYAGVFYIDNGTEMAAYRCYIDNGTSWDEVSPPSVDTAPVQRSSGTVTYTGSRLFVDCGFCPDVVTFEDHLYDENVDVGPNSPSFVFGEWSYSRFQIPYVINDGLLFFEVSRADTGFYVEKIFAWTPEGTILLSDATINYVAIKYS